MPTLGWRKKKVEEEPEKAKPVQEEKAAPEVEAAPQQQVVGITPEQLQQLIAAIKEPTEAEKKKLAEEAALNQRKTEERIKIAQEEEANRKANQAACGHRKPDGRSTIGGQIHSDGKVHPICCRCGKEGPPFKATPEQMRGGGVNLMDSNYRFPDELRVQ